MLLVQAKKPCALCTTLPSQGTLADGRAACIGCALIGQPQSGRALVAYQETRKLANNVVLSLLRGDRKGTVIGGRKILRNRLGTNVGAYNEFATALVKIVKQSAAGKHGIASDMGRRIDAAGFADSAFALYMNWFRAQSMYAGDGVQFEDGRAEQVKAAAASLYEPLAAQLGAFGARSLIEDALGPFGTARDSALGRLVPRIGDEYADDDIDGMGDAGMVFDGLFDPDSDLIGAEAAQMIDASLLRRARDKLQQLTKGKRYDTTRLEKELLKMFAANLRRSESAGANAAVYASGVAQDLARQTIVVNSRSRGTAEWGNFVAMAGNEFYRSDAALPPAVCRQSQADFVKAHPGDGSYPIVADELVNMAAFFNKRAFEAAAIPGADDDILAPTGAIKLAKTAEYRQVAQDLQRVRASLIAQLNAVCAEVGATVKKDAPLDGKTIVDQFLLTLFDEIWRETVPHAAPDKMSFAQIYSMYARKSGTAAQRRAAMLKDFFAGNKK